MKNHKVLENGFTWTSPDKSLLGGPFPPRKPETRTPWLWLARNGSELYLVNSSRETLDFVVADTGGFQTVDDDVMPVSSDEQYQYYNVQPNTAVKIDEYDERFDSDFILQVYLKVQSKSLGCLEIEPPAKKGGIEETVLLWDTGEPGTSVLVKTA